ncbi:MAG: glycoside hydrolase family 2, partial [Bacilli bacterium]|nr:glycoside hydrolase family 2 [Bacilli bacterium]
NRFYPRGQFSRESYFDLNGDWDFGFDDLDIGLKERWQESFPGGMKIRVPFSYQTAASGLSIPDEHPIVWYRRDIEMNPESFQDGRVILHFEGADYKTQVYVDGHFVGNHQGGYTRFSFDITDELRASNGKSSLVVRCEDRKEAVQPRGKQTWLKEPFGCWYKETNGIWKSVWLEIVPEIRLDHVKITPCLDDYFVEFEVILNALPKNGDVRIEISYQGTALSETTFHVHRRITNVKIDLNNDLDGFRVHYWTPDCPNLYDVRFVYLQDGVETDIVKSYFGFRCLRSVENCLLLNLNPIYLKMVLHQGYYRESGLTAPSYEALEKDIRLAKKLGFNGIRMHQKIEDERFYSLCDRIGMIVWCEMPSPYEFKEDTIKNLLSEWDAVVRQFYNHPSICAWVPINESWGIPRVTTDPSNQHLSQALYHLTKAYDPYRPVISNDGWEHTTSDIITLHNYAQSGEELHHFYDDLSILANRHKIGYSQTRMTFSNGFEYHGEPVIVSEFVGTSFENGKDKGWGYGNGAQSEKEYLTRFESLIQAIRSNDGICGYCITQLS